MFSTFFAHGALHTTGSIFGPVTNAFTYATNALAPIETPSPEVIMDLGIRGWLDEKTIQDFTRMHGVELQPSGNNVTGLPTVSSQDSLELWRRVYYARQELPSVHEFLTLANRGRLTDKELDLALQRLGYYSDRVRADVNNLRYEVPGPSDLVRFSVRHVFEPDIVAGLGYNDEFNATLDFFHRLQGLNYPIFSGPFGEQYKQFLATVSADKRVDPSTYARYGLEEPTWAQAFWWSHWVTISPSQAYEAYFRLRPGRNQAFDPPFARGIDFTLDNLLQSLRVNDYPPKLRPILAAIAHRIPGIRFLRQLRATEVFNQGDVKELLLRQGYSDGDAAVLAESVERNDASTRRKEIERQAKGQLAGYWELGIIDESDYLALLQQHGLTPEDAKDTVNLAQLDLKGKRVKKIVDFVHKQMITGQVNGAQALDELLQAGVTNSRAQMYVSDWELEVQVHHKQVSAQKAVQWACKGIISLGDLQLRLTNLDYLPQDAAGLIAEAQACQAVLAARAAAQAERDRNRTVRQLAQQQRAAAQAIVTARRQLASHGSPAQLRRWFCAGHLGQAELYARLRTLGWPDADITRLISDCQASKTSGKGGPRGGTQLSGGGPTGGTGGPAGQTTGGPGGGP